MTKSKSKTTGSISLRSYFLPFDRSKNKKNGFYLTLIVFDLLN